MRITALSRQAKLVGQLRQRGLHSLQAGLGRSDSSFVLRQDRVAQIGSAAGGPLGQGGPPGHQIVCGDRRRGQARHRLDLVVQVVAGLPQTGCGQPVSVITSFGLGSGALRFAVAVLFVLFPSIPFGQCLLGVGQARGISQRLLQVGLLLAKLVESVPGPSDGDLGVS